MLSKMLSRQPSCAALKLDRLLSGARENSEPPDTTVTPSFISSASGGHRDKTVALFKHETILSLVPFVHHNFHPPQKKLLNYTIKLILFSLPPYHLNSNLISYEFTKNNTSTMSRYATSPFCLSRVIQLTSYIS